MYICIYIYIYIHAHMYIYVHIYISICRYIASVSRTMSPYFMFSVFSRTIASLIFLCLYAPAHTCTPTPPSFLPLCPPTQDAPFDKIMLRKFQRKLSQAAPRKSERDQWDYLRPLPPIPRQRYKSLNSQLNSHITQ